MNKQCKLCKKYFKLRAPSEQKTRIYCSKQCQINSTKSVKIELICKTCNKYYKLVPSIAKNSKYCSKKCKLTGTRKVKDENYRICNKCKQLKTIESFSGQRNREYRCKECQKDRTKIRARGRYCNAKNQALRRKLNWSIEEHDYEKLIKMKCHYCQEKLNETGCGLDRKNNNEGYSLNNVVPCCSVCNVTRSDNYSYEEMLILAETIIKIKKSRSNYRLKEGQVDF